MLWNWWQNRKEHFTIFSEYSSGGRAPRQQVCEDTVSSKFSLHLKKKKVYCPCKSQILIYFFHTSKAITNISLNSIAKSNEPTSMKSYLLKILGSQSVKEEYQIYCPEGFPFTKSRKVVIMYQYCFSLKQVGFFLFYSVVIFWTWISWPLVLGNKKSSVGQERKWQIHI